MLLASGISLSRGFLLAAVLDPLRFGQYALVVATGTFLSLILSSGLVEGTYKMYPRMWSDARGAQIVENADQRFQSILLRFAFLAVLLTAASAGFGFDILSGFMMACVALSIITTTLFASVNRATTNVVLIANSTLLRATIALVCAAAGAIWFGFHGAIAGEIIGSFAGAWFTRWQCLQEASKLATQNATQPNAPSDTIEGQASSGYLIFLGFLAVAAPTFLDRSFVTWQFGQIAAGTYAFLILFVTAANVLAGVIAQNVGPRLLKMEHSGAELSMQIRYILRWAGFFWCAWATAIIVFYLLATYGPLDGFFRKYAVDGEMISVVFILGCCQLTVLLDYLLMSRNKERFIFVAGISFLTAASFAVCVAIAYDVSLVNFMLLYALAKLVHLGIQVECVRRTRHDMLIKA
jgi:hypothetical protein